MPGTVARISMTRPLFQGDDMRKSICLSGMSEVSPFPKERACEIACRRDVLSNARHPIWTFAPLFLRLGRRPAIRSARRREHGASPNPLPSRLENDSPGHVNGGLGGRDMECMRFGCRGESGEVESLCRAADRRDSLSGGFGSAEPFDARPMDVPESLASRNAEI